MDSKGTSVLIIKSLVEGETSFWVSSAAQTEVAAMRTRLMITIFVGYFLNSTNPHFRAVDFVTTLL